MKIFSILLVVLLCCLLVPTNAWAQAVDSARWSLSSTSLRTVTVTSNLTGQDQDTSWYRIVSYTGTNSSQRGGGSEVPGNGGWPAAETQRKATRWIDFKVRPTTGKYFIPDSIALAVGNSGGSNNLRADITWSTDSTTWTTLEYVTVPNTAMSKKSYSANLPTINDGQKIYLRVYPWAVAAVASGKYFNIQSAGIYGKTYDITTPTITTTAVSGILPTSATSGGNVTADGGANVTVRGVCWSTTTGPTISGGGNYLGATTDGTGKGLFVSTAAPLASETHYYLRAYATNSVGTTYGSEQEFTTGALSVPILSTTAISGLTETVVNSGGNVSSNGGVAITEYGICWNTTGSPDPSVDAKTVVGTSDIAGAFSGSANSLVAGSTYHLRSYAINSIGTGYGNEIVFTTVSYLYNVASSDVSILTNWGSGTDGSGTNPTSFAKDNQILYLYNTGATISSNWIVSGNGAKIVLGNGTDVNSLTIPSAASLTGTIDVSANATLTIQNTTNPALGILNSASTVVFDGSDSLTIPAATYGNLSSTNDVGAIRILASSGTISITGTFIAGSAAYTVTGSTVSFSGTLAQTIPTSTFYNLLINNNCSVPLGQTLTIDSSGAATIASSKTLTINGIFDNKSATNITLNGSLIIANSAEYKMDAVNGTIPVATFQSGSTIKILQSTGSRIPQTIGGNLYVYNTTGWLNYPTSTIGGDLIIYGLGGNSVNHGAGGSARTLIVTGNFELQSGTYEIGAVGNTVADVLTVNGNCTISGGALNLNSASAGTGTLNVKGNFVQTGGTLTTPGAGGSLVFNGSSAQTISAEAFSSLVPVTINNTAGVSLAGDLQINGTLTLTTGVLSLGTHNLTLGSSAVIGGTPSSTAMIYADGTGQLRKLFSATGSFTFPIGDVSGTAEYAPASLSVSASDYSAGAAYIAVNTTRLKHPNNTSTTDYLKRYWTASSSGFTGASYTGTFTYPTTDTSGNESLTFGAQYDASTWTNVGPVSTTSHNFSTPTLTVLGDFTCADGTVVPAVPILSINKSGLSFGRVNRNTTSTEQTYTLTGYYLDPAAGNITITAPANYEVSLASGSGFASSIEVAYTSNALSTTTVYVHFVAPNVTATTTYSGSVTNAGGGATTQNVSVTGKSIVANADLGVNMIIAADGTGDYTTWTAAIANIPTSRTDNPYIVYVRPGCYNERVIIPASLTDDTHQIQFIGEDRDNTVIWTDNFVERETSSLSYTIAINVSNFVAKNITFENTYWPNRYGAVSGTQGQAVVSNGDRQEYINCVFNGYQDTYWRRGSSGTGRAYHKNCIFKGTVDFIYGRNIAVFDSCTIIIARAGGVVTANGTDAASLYGEVFRNCTLLGDTVGSTDSTGWVRSAYNAASGYYLGRPWQGGPRTVYMHCYESANIHAAGWTTMSVNPTIYTEYNCFGPGSATSRPVIFTATSQPSTITDGQATNYTLTNIFAMASASSSSLITSDWYPSQATAGDDVYDGLLPVELNSFTAVANGLAATLSWKTASEVNNYGFEIERRTVGGNSDWLKVGFIAGSGTSATPHEYKFEDKSVTVGRFNYRLKQVDNNGNFKYSSNAEIEIGSNVPRVFTLNQNYPNPFNPATTIEFTLAEDSKISLKIFDLLGREVVTLVNDIMKAGIVHQVPFNASALSSGLYFYRLEAGSKSLVKKLMLVK